MKEFLVKESAGEKKINLAITNSTIVDTHCLLFAITHQAYNDRYADLKTQYPNLEPFTQHDKYDQAECKPPVLRFYPTNSWLLQCRFPIIVEDFSLKTIPFMIRANSTEPEYELGCNYYS